MNSVMKNAIVVSLIILLLPSLAIAGGEAGWARLGWQAANLFLLLAIIIYFGRKPVSNALKVRSEVISNEIDEASRLHAEAKEMLMSYEEKLAGLDDQVEAMMKQYKESGEAEKARLIAEGEAEAKRILGEAERTAQGEFIRARAKIESEVIERAIAEAEQSIVENLNPSDHRRLTAEYLGQLETAVRGS
jgi:F-type H+-transporting ATPase subunit b